MALDLPHGGRRELQCYTQKLKEATWVPHVFRVSVMQHEYMNEGRQRITVRTEAPVDCAAESKYMLEEIAKLFAC
ncbi:unnamed protein product [Urochloa humidicola]